jgi:hypothetical protein
MATPVRPGGLREDPRWAGGPGARRVRRQAPGSRSTRDESRTHQFLTFAAEELERVECPKGWMSPEGFNRYLAQTLAKLRERSAARPDAGGNLPGRAER